MDDNDGLVERTVATVTRLAGRVAHYATLLLLFTVVICVGSFWLGLEALSGGIESVWAMLGVVFGAIAIGCAVLARLRIGRVRRHVPQIASEVRALVAGGDREAMTVIDVFDTEAESAADPDSPRALPRSVVSMRTLSGSSVIQGATMLTEAVRAITSFPWLALVSVAITSVFGFMALVFLIALAL
jgi:hypothetical protein